jgi:hypothetical protein
MAYSWAYSRFVYTLHEREIWSLIGAVIRAGFRPPVAAVLTDSAKMLAARTVFARSFATVSEVRREPVAKQVIDGQDVRACLAFRALSERAAVSGKFIHHPASRI